MENIELINGITTRASSGNFYNQFRDGYRVQISWSVNSQNISNNTSNVTVRAQLVSTGSSYTINSSATKQGSLTINGTTYSFTFSASLSGNQTKAVYTKTVDIPHNSDGSKTFSMSTTLGINVTLSGKYWGNVSTNGNGNLDTIPRSSSFTLSQSSVTLGTTQQIINITRASGSFTHKIYYKLGSINTELKSDATTSYSFTRSVNDSDQLPNSISGTATIVVDTYNGTTKIGSDSNTFTVVVPDSIKPSMSSLSASVVASGADISYGYVKGKSKCNLVINGASGNQGSTIKSYSISGGGYSSSSQNFTTGDLNSSGDITFTAYVTDSRGRKSDSKAISISVTDYMNPNITGFVVARCTSDGTLNDDGTYLKISPTYTYSTVNNKNTITSKAEFKPTNASTWANAGAINSGSSLVTGSNTIFTDQSYDVKFTITDKFTSVFKSVIIPTSFAILDIKKGGKGIAFGKAAEMDNLLDIGMNMKLTNSTISKEGTSQSWLNGARGIGCMLNMTSQSGYSPIIRQKTIDGAWTWGVYNNDTYNLTYITDTNINDGNNSPNTQYMFPKDKGGVVYTTGNKPSASDIGAAASSHSHNYASDSHTHDSVNYANGSNYTHKWESNGYGTSYLQTGNGDDASWSTHNVILRTWNGLGVRDNSDTCRFLIDARSGNVFAKGYMMATKFTQSSDERLKTNITPIRDKFEKFFMELKPVNYTMIDIDDGRMHTGFLAQDIEKSMINNNITYEEFAGLEKTKYAGQSEPDVPKQIVDDVSDPNNTYYSLSYAEFTSLNTHMIQKFFIENTDSKNKIKELEDRVLALEIKFNTINIETE